MEKNTSQSTISDSKEESIAKAIALLQNEQVTKPPLHRPNIPTLKILAVFVLWLFGMVGLIFAVLYIGRVFKAPAFVAYLIAICGCVLIIVLKFKALVVNSVLLYQKHAPERLRRSCLFVPSCSEYMLLAVEKYGVIVGVCKGLHRLSRCHHPNGGEDYP